MSPRKIAVVQRRLTHYRVPFFECLRERLRAQGQELVLACGQAAPSERSKDDAATLDWAIDLPTRYFMGDRLCWQPFAEYTGDAALRVLTLENRLLCNLPAQFRREDRRLALWGHGANLQGDAESLRERFKRRVARQADWWFGYTQASVPLLARAGFPSQRVTILNNAVDTSRLRRSRAAITPARQAALRAQWSLTGHSVGVYVGSLYRDKRIDFMLRAAREIRAHVPDFEFLVVGDGQDRPLVEQFCREAPWARYLGARTGDAKVEVLALADVLIHPGALGLGVLDSFACGVPLVTTDCGTHGPEFAYLRNEANARITPDTLADFVSGAVSLLVDGALRARLAQACNEDAKVYTVESMADRFARGVEQCLAAPLYRFG